MILIFEYFAVNNPLLLMHFNKIVVVFVRLY